MKTKPKPLTAIAVAVAAAAVLLWLGVPPLTLVLIGLVAACPLSMAFMHGGHGGQGGQGCHGRGPHEREQDGTNPRHQQDDHGGTDLTKKDPQHH
ncbi:DUF2933 domain-containing protein [Streptomyces sp. HUCO-GS316]|uniref:DUF2933 domain-containing protein n=1 Tax=Streptomyces sp. HUCO-GS316 TaxID=2692198 RepID=UPI00136D96B8|nr:DUF2933 domain-containing protein [Streptomyces sp. HUCO-GS316]MXM62779.1 DUF2933 domain-containing protein [Streptomyces sp. HUCO-GS316]